MEFFTDPSFNKNFTQHYNLLIEIELQQLSCILYEKEGGKIAALKRITLPPVQNEIAFAEQLNKTITSEDLLHYPVKEIKVSVLTGTFTFIPRLLFEDSMSHKYVQFPNDMDLKSEIIVNSFKKLSIKNVNTIPKTLKQILHKHFSLAKIFHITSPLIEWAADNQDEFNDAQIVLDVRQDAVYILYFKNHEFIYLNQFSFKHKEDFIYYVLFVVSQFNIDRNTCDLKLCGFILPDSVLYNELYKYFLNVSFVTPYEHFTIQSDEIPMHFYHTLLSLHLCA